MDLFVENFGGLFIACDAPTTPDGGRLNLFSQGGITINIKCNFQPTWDENLERKDTTITMAFAYGYCLNISSYGSHSLQTNEPLERLPIEGAGGIAPYLDMQSFKDSLDTWAAKEGYDPSKIVIARATAVLPYEFPSDINLLEYRYPSSLFPAHRDFKDDTTLVKYYYPIDDYDLVGSSLGAINRS